MSTIDGTPAATGTTAANAVREELLKNTKMAQAERERMAVEEEKAKLPPVLALGRRGKEYMYYSRTYKQEFSLKAGEHTKMNLLALAPMEELTKWLFPDRGEKDAPTTRELVDVMARRLLDESGRKGACGYDTLRGAGCWQTDAGILYNAGDACYLCPPDGTPRRCSNIRTDGGKVTIHDTRRAMPHPAAEALTDEEGEALLKLYQARAWVNDWNADILAGWTVCALLGEAMPFRPHVWINAPSNTGKTELKNALCRALGTFPVVLESAKTTEAACRGMLENGTRPVAVDEADARADDNKQVGNLSALVELARSATSGGVIRKGTPDGGAKEYLMASPFLFFSIRNVLSKEEDLNRFALLEMRKLPAGQELDDLCRRWKEAYSVVTAHGYTEKLLTRVLTNAERMRRLADELATHIRRQALAARTAEYTACVMAGAWVLTHSGEMPDTYRARAVMVAKALAEAVQEDNESMRALLHLLGYRPTGTRTVEQLARAAAIGSPEEKKRAAEELAACKMKVAPCGKAGAEKEVLYLQVLQSSPTVAAAFEKTPWRVTGRDTVGQTLSRIDGVLYGDKHKARIWTAYAMRCIFIPARYWNGEP